MASKSKATGASGAFGGLMAGVNASLESDNKNRFKRIEKSADQRFQIAKMYASDELARDRNMFDRQQQDIMSRNRDFQQQVWKKMADDNKAQEVDPNEMAAFTTGKFTPAMTKGLGELALEDQIALIAEMAKQKGFAQSGEREVETGEKEGGVLWMGKRPVKRNIPVYSKNHFQR